MLLPQLTLASTNKGKLRELRSLLGDAVGELTSLAELGIAPAEEPHCTFVENALAKARAASAASGQPALADDSGICVDALGGAPGVHSARYAPTSSDLDNNALLLERLAGEMQRCAHYHCALVLCRHAQDPCPLIAEGRWHGKVGMEPRGSGGFGYDPLFVTADGRTVAQLEPAAKNACSHRSMAVRKLRDMLVG